MDHQAARANIIAQKNLESQVGHGGEIYRRSDIVDYYTY